MGQIESRGSAASTGLSLPSRPTLFDEDGNGYKGGQRIKPSDVEQSVYSEASQGNASEIGTGC